MLGYDDYHASAAVLFEDFGENAGESDINADVAFLAQSVFDTKVQLEEKLEKAGKEHKTSENLVAMLDVILPQVEEVVAEKIIEIKNNGDKVKDSVITITISVPQIAIDNGKVDLVQFNNDSAHVEVVATVKPKPTNTDPTGTGTGSEGVNQG
jgi:hypothetical protein